MSRKQPEATPPDVTKWSKQGPERKIGETNVVVQTREYKLITPLFGGGVEPGVNDPITLIRGTEIRGQLRFWWRAIRGGQFGGDLAKMKKREDAIWGAANTAKPRTESSDEKSDESEPEVRVESVQIIVDITKQGKSIEPFQIKETETYGKKKFDSRPNNLTLGYVVFPLQPPRDELTRAKKKEDISLKTIQEDIVFTLTISFAVKWKDEIQAALWAWETFGGIGARTRRGFGSLQLEKVDKQENKDLPLADPVEAREWLAGNLKHWIKGEKYPDNVPHLTLNPRLYVSDFATSPMRSWAILINKLKEFRQSRRSYHDKDGKVKPGRSNWPEAEAIRQKTGDRSLKRPSLGHPQKYPRAVFGLPIVFHFKDEREGDPHDMTLQGPEGQDRLASPLILRPLICQKGQTLGLALYLEGVRLPDKLSLEGRVTNQVQKFPLNVSETQLIAREAATVPILVGQTDVLQAFLNFLEK
jgi:CRISPR-associated protein Cmr1